MSRDLKVLIQLKKRLDPDLRLLLPDSAQINNTLDGKIAIVTGGNSGIGFAVTKQLLSFGCSNVVMACRSETKCLDAVAALAKSDNTLGNDLDKRIHPMVLDLSDLASVKSFATKFTAKFPRLDILVNNAGSLPRKGSRTTEGYEEAFGSMHLGHFALTKWLLNSMLKPIDSSNNPNRNTINAARVINVASDAMFFGSFHPSLFNIDNYGNGDLKGEITDNCGYWDPFHLVPCCPIMNCPHTNGYARAKLANVMHAYELQKRIDDMVVKGKGSKKNQRRIVTASLMPGVVHTNILTFSTFITSFLKQFFRSNDDSAYIVTKAILSNDFIPTSYIDGIGKDHDLFNYKDAISNHFQAFPQAKSLPFASLVFSVSQHYANYKANKYNVANMLWSYKPFIFERDFNVFDHDLDHDKERPILTATADSKYITLSLSEVDKEKSFELKQVQDENLEKFRLMKPKYVARKLWDVSEAIVDKWESDRRPFWRFMKKSGR